MADAKYIHLVMQNCNYEGYGHPESAFLSEEKADKMVFKLNKKYGTKGSYYEVVSVPIDDAPAEVSND
jgi:hypothetical protein